ncbi:hypothetical protein BGZ93_005935 [Podila epicladia]|nr:hypothetical protein BGZ93_005935 [Podila epicladia]
MSTEANPVLFSHASAVFMHKLVYLSLAVELSLVDIQLQYKNDWDLVVDAIDFSLLVALNLFRSYFRDITMLFEKMGESAGRWKIWSCKPRLRMTS